MTVMRSTDFRSVVEPILNEVFDGIYDQRADEYKQIFEVSPGIARNYHEEPVLYGFGAAPELPDGTPITYQMGGVLFVQRIPYKVYGLAFALTQVLVEDGDHIHMGKTYSEHLGQSGIETQETLCSLILDRAYNASYPGGDGVSLGSSVHPIASGATFSNILSSAAALSQTSLEQMLIQIRTAVNNTNFKVRVNPVKLVIAPSNVFQAEVLIKSVLRTGTANNDINPVKSMGMLTSDTAVISRQSSATQWGIKTDVKNGLVVKTRRKLTKGMEGDFETDSMRYKFTFRQGQSWIDPRCYFSTPGL